MSLKDPSSKLLRWKIKLNEYNFEIKYKQGKSNTNADALSRIRAPFEIINSNENIFAYDNNIVHCISEDKTLSQCFADQINAKFNSWIFLQNKKSNVIIQPIYERKLLFHLVTK